MVEGELKSGSSTTTAKGTEGLFAAVKSRGNVLVDFTAATGLTQFDSILKNLDTQGAIEENMLFLNRETSLDFDDMLAGVGQHGWRLELTTVVVVLLVYLKTLKKWH